MVTVLCIKYMNSDTGCLRDLLLLPLLGESL